MRGDSRRIADSLREMGCGEAARTPRDGRRETDRTERALGGGCCRRVRLHGGPIDFSSPRKNWGFFLSPFVPQDGSGKKFSVSDAPARHSYRSPATERGESV